MRIGALEAGGTKMVCAVGDENGQILERVSIATGKPEKTMPGILDFFHQYALDDILCPHQRFRGEISICLEALKKSLQFL